MKAVVQMMRGYVQDSYDGAGRNLVFPENTCLTDSLFFSQ